MAFLTPGTTVGPDALSVAQAHALVDSAFLLALKNGDLPAALRLINVTTPGTPATGDLRVGTDGILEAYISAAWADLAPEPLQLTLTNKSGSNLVAGDVVVADPTNADSFTIASTSRPQNVIGVLAADIANNASGLVNVRGNCTVKIVNSPASSALSGWAILSPDGTGTSKTSARSFPYDNPWMSDIIGFVLADTANSANVTGTCFIFK